MSGGIPLLPLYALSSWTVKTLHLYGLFNKAVDSSGYVVSNIRMVNELYLHCKVCGKKKPWPFSRYCRSILLEWLCKSAGNCNRGSYQNLYRLSHLASSDPLMRSGTYTSYTGLPLLYCPTVTVNWIWIGEPGRHSLLVAMSRVMSVVKRDIICSGANMIITNGVEGSYPLVRVECSLCFTYHCQ